MQTPPTSTPIQPTQTPTSTSTSTSTPEPQVERFRVIAYATEAIIPEIIPYDKLTHINYSFLVPNADGSFVQLTNAWKLKKIVETAHSQNVKVSIAVGGWGWDEQFEQMAASAESRSAFVQNLKAFVDEYQLDGVDMDWEYPDPGQSSLNYVALMTELRAALPDKLISTAVISYGDDTGLGIPTESFELVDYVNVMTYDGYDHGTMEQFEKGLNYWSSRGVSKEKLNIGVPFYARPGPAPYAKLVETDPAAAQTDTFDYFGTIQNYNGIPTIKKKTEIAMQQSGGIMFWELSHDAQGELSLVNAIFEVVSNK
ncbi:MAG: hypothetical protein J0M11_05775 [Anaerolineae bacterium]|nr:hypothetical protein [Anaerolineae bacterium]